LGKGPIAQGTKGCVGLTAAMVISDLIISYIQPPHTKQYKIQTTNIANTKYLKINNAATEEKVRRLDKMLQTWGKNGQLFLVSG